jgi:hypothetical protein
MVYIMSSESSLELIPGDRTNIRVSCCKFPTSLQRFQIVDVLQKVLSHDRCTGQSPTSFQLILANPLLPLGLWLARNWWGESSRILPVWTEVVVVVAAADELAGSATDD